MNTELFIFSLVSLVILIPVIYLLPLNLSAKGKGIVVAISFFISIAVLLTKLFFPLWQSILMLIALILLSTMLLTKKFSPLLFSSDDESRTKGEELKPEREQRTKPLAESEAQLEFPSLHKIELGTIHADSLVEVKKEAAPSLAVEKGVLQDLQALDRLKQGEIIGPADLEVSKEIYPSPIEESNPVIEEFFVDRTGQGGLNELADSADSDEQKADIHVDQRDKDGSMNYLSELEEMMLDSQTENVESIPLNNVQNEIEAFAPIEKIEDMEQNTELDQVKDLDEVDALVQTEEFEQAEEVEQAEALVEEQVNKTTATFEEFDGENLHIDDSIEQEIQSIEEQEAATEDIDEQSPLVDDRAINVPLDHITNFTEIADITDIAIENNDEFEEDVNVLSQFAEQERKQEELQKQIYQTMLVQAEILKKMLDHEGYERILQAYLSYEIPAAERYTFASMLAQYYIEIENYPSLVILLNQMEEDFKDYPILFQEIQYLQAHYTVK